MSVVYPTCDPCTKRVSDVSFNPLSHWRQKIDVCFCKDRLLTAKADRGAEQRPLSDQGPRSIRSQRTRPHPKTTTTSPSTFWTVKRWISRFDQYLKFALCNLSSLPRKSLVPYAMLSGGKRPVRKTSPARRNRKLFRSIGLALYGGTLSCACLSWFARTKIILW